MHPCRQHGPRLQGCTRPAAPHRHRGWVRLYHAGRTRRDGRCWPPSCPDPLGWFGRVGRRDVARCAVMKQFGKTRTGDVTLTRSAPRAAQRIANRIAMHPTHAMPGKACGLLISKVRSNLIARGHTRHLASSTTPDSKMAAGFPRLPSFSPADFILRSDGTVRLNPDLTTHTVARTAQLLAGHIKEPAPAGPVNVPAQG